KIYFPKKGVIKQGADAKGKKINATIGMAIEDDGTPMRLSSIADCISLDPQDIFPYAPSYGLPDLREAWQNLIRQKNPSLKGVISLPVATCGLTHALSIVGYLFINPSDSIIITDKFWGNYRLIFGNGYDSIFKPYNSFRKGGFDTESFRQKLADNKGKQIILFSLPNNPTGYTPTEDETETIARIIRDSAERGNEIIVINDDAYFGLVYEPGVCRESLFTKLADLHENVLAVKVDGGTKEYYAWGLRIGFVTYGAKNMDSAAYRALEDKTAGAIRGSISNASRVSQTLLLKAITSKTLQQEKKKKFDLLKTRFDKVREVVHREKKYERFFTPLPFNSGYFMCIELKEGLDAESIRQTLLNEYSTGIIALGNLIRIAYSSVAEGDIPTLFENIYEVCRQSQKAS
ncbi:MAG: aminotransferase class I/II-fold pyridoxal phosphate-dependent enzyme, partial [bacterium]